MAENNKQSVEDKVRDSLREVAEVVTKLAPLCNNFDELLELIALAQNNDAQLRLLISQIAPPARKGAQ